MSRFCNHFVKRCIDSEMRNVRTNAPTLLNEPNVLMLRMTTSLLWFRRSLLAVLILLGAASLWAQGLQWLLRQRAEKLLTDIRSLKGNRSSWADAQKLMSKWCRWGEYRGVCTAQDCKYIIHF